MNCILSALQQRCLLYGFVLADVVISRTRQLPSIPIPPQRKFESTTVAAGAIYSTVEDMFLWDRALCTGQVLGKQYRDLMFRPNNEVPEVKAAGGRSRSIYGYGWQIYSRNPLTKQKTKVVNHGGAIYGFRAMESRLLEDDAFIVIICNQGDRIGSSDVWNAIVRLNTELSHVITGQPYRMQARLGFPRTKGCTGLSTQMELRPRLHGSSVMARKPPGVAPFCSSQKSSFQMTASKKACD